MNPKIVIVGYRSFSNLAKQALIDLPPWVEYEITEMPLQFLTAPDSVQNLQSFFETGTIVICGDRSASYLRKMISNFVVQIKVTGFDLLEIISQIGSKEIVVMNFREGLDSIDKIASLLNVRIRQIQFQDFEEASAILESLQEEGITDVVGGSWICEAAPQFGMRGHCYYTQNSMISAFQFAYNILKTYRTEIEKFAQFKTIVDMNRSGVISLDTRSRVKIISKTTEQLLGMKSKQAIGKPLHELIPSLIAANPTLLGNEPQYNLIFEHNHRKLAVDVVPVHTHGVTMGHILALDDVANLQEIEQKIRKKITQKPMVANYGFHDIIGSSSTLQESIRQAKKFSRANSSILIHGESGTGKELFAQSIHRMSARHMKPFVAVNCAALPETLIDSELFGYEEGSFTGARKGGKVGLFELAHQGTIFLDEISELPLHLQSRLLRVLQEKEIVRIGGDQVIPIDVRIIAASNKDLLKCIKEGTFREDLYFRIGVLQLSIPPLRRRKEDIPLLFKHFIQSHERLATKVEEIDLDLLLSYQWPGNVRELENVAERFLVLSEGEKLTRGTLRDLLHLALFPTSSLSSPIEDREEEALSEAELIEKALTEANGNKEKAAQILGISRTTLWRKMRAE